jgi:hypothetical protein
VNARAEFADARTPASSGKINERIYNSRLITRKIKPVISADQICLVLSVGWQMATDNERRAIRSVEMSLELD